MSRKTGARDRIDVMLQTRPEDMLRETFGFPGFRPGQSDIVDHILAGRPTLCVMPTGAGKSICYQLPALMLDGMTVVISPLTALMDDQVAALQANGVAAAAIHSGRDRVDNVETWRQVQSGDVQLLYLSPERLMTPRMLAALEALDPAMFVVDEAHCISKWGASFRPEYEDLSKLCARFPSARLAAFTATADEATRQDIADKLFGQGGEIVVHGFDRPNLTLGVAAKASWKSQLLEFLDDRRSESGIIYCLSRKSTEEVAGLLREEGVNALPYHAGLSPETRRENQERFMAEEAVVMVATIAFGMGIDKPDIRYVFHLHMPGSMEAYYQEIGRAGRDGQPAETMMLFGLSDARMRRQFIDQDGEDGEHKRREHKRLDSLLAYCEATRCRRISLLAYFGETGRQACGNCDLCLDPPVLIDGSLDAQKLFSAILRTGEMFGAAHVIDVLRGADTEKVRARGHDSLPTYGVGSDRPKPFWQGLIRQSVAAGLIEIDIQGFGALKLAGEARAVLKGEQTFKIREISTKPPKSRRAPKSSSVDPSTVDATLLAALKARRRELAAERNVPAYVVFSDATLIDMAQLRPTNLELMASVNGVGPKKLETFGQIFLDVLQEHGGPN
ncbi:MAG: DNA helicase RecQ [Maricaulis sp.]|nr:DNA helicase RecQ [Maricaulis sp.]